MRYYRYKMQWRYTESRIKYPKFVFETILDYVKKSLGKSPKYPLAVDVGCGPELMSTVFLAPYFDKVLGVDISESQIEQATLNNKHSNIEYRLSAAESLPVEDNSVTLIQVATALHWFDLDKFYRECDRVLVPGGVVAAFCYAFKDFPIVNHPHGDEIHKVLTKITDKLVSPDINPYYTEHCTWVLNRYTSPEVQIPYKDTKRLMEAYETDDPEAPLTYKLEVFMLLGRTPILYNYLISSHCMHE
ncbi:hypothetical protein EB796_002119 [Bugula neritina]|uniref:Methyltransferase type 11 domain-containing protein n=1 Tax=Bugula neritina TaxID=10212 RepID=A0A7J7KN22_BUGNE|nr:hypothetical protein EB796_002119 [Bugula neritina]